MNVLFFSTVDLLETAYPGLLNEHANTKQAFPAPQRGENKQSQLPLAYFLEQAVLTSILYAGLKYQLL